MFKPKFNFIRFLFKRSSMFRIRWNLIPITNVAPCGISIYRNNLLASCSYTIDIYAMCMRGNRCSWLVRCKQNVTIFRL